MGPHLGCGDALCASGCSFSYRCRARVSLVMTHGYQPVTLPPLPSLWCFLMSSSVVSSLLVPLPAGGLRRFSLCRFCSYSGGRGRRWRPRCRVAPRSGPMLRYPSTPLSGSHECSAYPAHLTSTSLRTWPPWTFFQRAQSISSISHSASSPMITGGGWLSSVCCDGNGSFAAGRNRSTWNVGCMPEGTSSCTLCGRPPLSPCTSHEASRASCCCDSCGRFVDQARPCPSLCTRSRLPFPIRACLLSVLSGGHRCLGPVRRFLHSRHDSSPTAAGDPGFERLSTSGIGSTWYPCMKKNARYQSRRRSCC